MANPTIQFNTGRGYSPDGQVIIAAFHKNGYDSLEDFYDKCFEDTDPDLDPYVIFHDKTRGIKGKISLCSLTQKDIMRSYDLGFYVDC